MTKCCCCYSIKHNFLKIIKQNKKVLKKNILILKNKKAFALTFKFKQHKYTFEANFKIDFDTFSLKYKICMQSTSRNSEKGRSTPQMWW